MKNPTKEEISGPKGLILDVDTGVDDALAICLACRRPEAEVVLITTVAGNTDLEQATANTLLVLEQIGPGQTTTEVARGSAKPLERELFCAHEVHGDDGLGGASEHYPAVHRAPLPTPAWRAIAEAALAAPGELTLVATGPLTNVAQVARNSPGTLDLLRSLVVMGGAVEERGNVTEHAEFNIYVDPEAAELIFSSDIPLTLVPLDVTHQVVLERRELMRWKSLSGQKTASLLSFIEAVTDLTMGFHGQRCGIDGLYLHDPLAVAVALDPSLVEVKRARLKVDLGEDRRGKVTAQWDEEALPLVATAVDVQRFMAMLREGLADY
jgi:purine nucleosidase